MEVWVSEHQGVSSKTGKTIKGTSSMSVRDHMWNCNHVVAWEDFSIISRESNHYLLETKESLLLKEIIPQIVTNYFSHLTGIIFVLKIRLW